MKKITLLFVFTMLTVLTYGQTYYVKDGGDDSNTGTQASPLATIQGAIDKAGEVTTKLIVYIDGTVNHNAQIKPDRDMDIIGVNSGVLNGPGSGAAMAKPIFDISGTKNNPVTGIVVTLQDLTVQNMFTTAGGTVINVNGKKSTEISVVLTSCVFKNNSAINQNGGVVSFSNVTDTDNKDFVLDIKKCYFEGVNNIDDSDPNNIVDNNAKNGGCLYLYNSKLKVDIENSTFRNFYSTLKAGAISVADVKTFRGVNLTIADNVCTTEGALIESAGIQIVNVDGNTCELQNSIIVNNTCPNTDANAGVPPVKVVDTNLKSVYTDLLVQHCLIGSVIIGDDYNTSVIDPSKFTNSIYGDKDGVGAPVIDGFNFVGAENVYKFNDGTYPVLRGKSMFLSELKDQNDMSRGPEETVDVDAGAWHSGYQNVASVASHDLLNARLKVYENNSGKVVVEFSGIDDQVASVYSIVGVKLLDVAIENEMGTFEVAKLKPGVYIIYIDVAGSVIAKQFIIE